MSDGIHPTFQMWTTSSSLERLRALTATVNLDQLAPVVGPMVMDMERGRAWRALWAAEVEEASESVASAPTVAAAAAPTATTSAASTAPLAQEESMDTDEPAAASAAAPSTGASSAAAPPHRPRLEKLRREALAAKPESNQEPPPDVVIGSHPWHSNVPRVRNGSISSRTVF